MLKDMIVFIGIGLVISTVSFAVLIMALTFALF